MVLLCGWCDGKTWTILLYIQAIYSSIVNSNVHISLPYFRSPVTELQSQWKLIVYAVVWIYELSVDDCYHSPIDSRCNAWPMCKFDGATLCYVGTSFVHLNASWLRHHPCYLLIPASIHHSELANERMTCCLILRYYSFTLVGDFIMRFICEFLVNKVPFTKILNSSQL